MQPKIIFEDKDILVIDKPSGWIVNEAETTKDQPTVQRWLNRNFEYPISSIESLRSGIVHRLDKETSGILLVAKTEAAFKALQQQFKNREVEKKYLALVHGRMMPKAGKISAPVGRLPWRRDRFGVLLGGRSAETAYKIIDEYRNEDGEYSLVELKPKTGRTHQIRIHLKYLGHPVVGDEFYAGRKIARQDRIWCPRLFLHAAKIRFFHPKDGKEMLFSAKLPEDLEKTLHGLLKAK